MYFWALLFIIYLLICSFVLSCHLFLCSCIVAYSFVPLFLDFRLLICSFILGLSSAHLFLWSWIVVCSFAPLFLDCCLLICSFVLGLSSAHLFLCSWTGVRSFVSFFLDSRLLIYPFVIGLSFADFLVCSSFHLLIVKSLRKYGVHTTIYISRKRGPIWNSKYSLPNMFAKYIGDVGVSRSCFSRYCLHFRPSLLNPSWKVNTYSLYVFLSFSLAYFDELL